MSSKFGEFFRRRRVELGLTLRRFCLEAGLDPGNVSKIERGLLPPPGREKLEEYGRHLKLQPGSDAYLEFFDLAAAESGRLPGDLLENEELMDKLPVLFRTIRGQRVTPEKLDALIEFIRRGK